MVESTYSKWFGMKVSPKWMSCNLELHCYTLPNWMTGMYRAGWGPGGSSGARQDRMETVYEYWLGHECPNPTERRDRQTGESTPPGHRGRTQQNISRTKRETLWLKTNQRQVCLPQVGEGQRRGGALHPGPKHRTDPSCSEPTIGTYLRHRWDTGWVMIRWDTEVDWWWVWECVGNRCVTFSVRHSWRRDEGPPGGGDGSSGNNILPESSW